jgi:hypothetical protein
LQQHGRWARHHNVPHFLPHEQFTRDQAGFDRFPEPYVVSYEEIDSREPQCFAEGFQLVGIEPDASTEWRLEEIGVGWLWDRFRVHYTPKHGSWLNQAEIEISLFSRQCLGRRRIPSLGDLRREAKAWGRRMNRNRVTIDWRFTRKEARLKFGYKRNQIMRSET